MGERKDLLRYGGEDAEPSTELFDGSSGFEPAVPFLLLGFKKFITEMFPLLWGECAQDPVCYKTKKMNFLGTLQIIHYLTLICNKTFVWLTFLVAGRG